MLNNERLDRFVRDFLASACEVEPSAISDDTSLDALGVDSHRLLHLASQVQAHFSCELAPETVLDLFLAERVSDLVELVSERNV